MSETLIGLLGAGIFGGIAWTIATVRGLDRRIGCLDVKIEVMRAVCPRLKNKAECKDEN